MTLGLKQKEVIVSEVLDIARQAVSAVAADYCGLTVGQMTRLRKEAREMGVYLRVVRNTLVHRAVEGTDFHCMQPALKGPLVYAFSAEDPGAPARLMRAFAKDNDRLVVRVVAIGGRAFGVEALERVANLPTREQALGQLVGVIQAPVTKLVRTTQATYAGLVRVIAAVAEKKKS